LVKTERITPHSQSRFTINRLPTPSSTNNDITITQRDYTLSHAPPRPTEMTDFITGLAHINLNVPDKAALAISSDFWSGVLGLKEIPVPALQRDSLKW